VLPPPTPVILVGGTLAAGTLSTVVGTDNKLATTETSGASIATNTASIDVSAGFTASATQSITPTVAARPTSLAVQQAAYKRIGAKSVTLAAGAATNQVLVSKTASYYCAAEIIGLWADTARTYNFIFQDEDDTACLPANMNAAGKGLSIAIATPNVPVMLEQPITVWVSADNKDLEVDVSGGGGVETLVLFYRYWLET
jgi:hypothetical protein